MFEKAEEGSKTVGEERKKPFKSQPFGMPWVASRWC